jgi:tetratricopeptide (TPR) repeat protein
MPLPPSSLLAALVAGALACTAAGSTPITLTPDEPDAPASPLLESRDRSGAVQALPGQGATGHDAMQALSQGRWASACATATHVLAHKVPDVEALGIFALCSAVSGDRNAAAAAQARLKQAEPSPYYGLLTQGVLHLQDKQPEKAQGSWRALLQARGNDPLLLYFEGEALHARKQPAQAVTAFGGALKAWPDFAPALTALARLGSGPKASPQDLHSALSLAERATQIEPSNRGYWALLADLCRRTGQVGRADAIALQYLRQPKLPALR